MAEKLRREVEPPQRHHTGLGVMLIASAAMFFAVAGSAFILRARMADSCCARTHGHGAAPHAVRVQVPTAPVPAPPTDCGRAIYRTSSDGAMSVTYELCPPEARQPIDATIPGSAYSSDLEPSLE